MDAAKLYAVTNIVKQEIENFNIPGLIANVIAHLQQSITQPDETTSIQFKNTLEEYKKATHSCWSNEFTVAEKRILSEISGDSLTGIGIYEAVENILNKNLVTPGEALASLQKISSELTQFTNYLNSVNLAFGGFNIEPDELSEDDCEIAYILPRACIDGSLESISDEMKKLNNFLSTIQEILQVDQKSPSINKLSNSEFEIFLTSTPAIILFIVTILERLVALFKRIAETHKIYKDMKSQKLPLSITDPLKKHIEQTISSEMSKLADKLVKENYKKDDEARKNELITKLQGDLKFIADRLDSGAILEVNTGKPKEPLKSKTDEEASDKNYKNAQKEYQDKMKMLEKIHNTRKLLEDLSKEGKQILYLPEEKKDEENEKEQPGE